MDLLKAAEENTPKKPKKYPFYYKFFSLLSVVRGYNIVIIVIAQYLASIFIFAPEKSLRGVLLNLDLYLIVLATICVIASGYIINNFYDVDKDKINKPQKTKLDSIVTQQTKLYIYFTLNFLGFAFAFFVSWKAAVFFAVYIFSIWFYSHKLRHYPLVKLFSAAILALLPFFVIFVYYRNFSTIIFTHACFLFFILLIRELIKDLETIQGDIVSNYMTLPIKYGERFTKTLITLIVFLTIPPILFLLKYPEIGLMKYYFYFTAIVLLVFLILLWRSNTKKNYMLLHTILKLLIIAGVFSLAFIDTSVIIKRIL
ncbi:geranylgeranylglycerol-phosphate geranylgeranyltransferase [Aureibaculum sp. A20]|uniref:Geranylgeranylglycerol-phosphate geranylgeranyltransferase n=1 Tax=Aureibaculum flavum TaxID=2795986 RepID=A0ABS0WPW2_9FLAO|nr:geranylgeranylglycerol-phosphate geranylgeranyltransferase [Aureibaculum flavum]MBJ2174028.1 geranylgeranylglycerol-phosphate geranylgeranyltransferase [Aureibaculum flavum]